MYMYIGGYPKKHEYSYLTNTDFSGCIKDVQIGQKAVNINEYVSAYTVKPGCPAKVSPAVHDSMPGKVDSAYVSVYAFKCSFILLFLSADLS